MAHFRVFQHRCENFVLSCIETTIFPDSRGSAPHGETMKDRNLHKAYQYTREHPITFDKIVVSMRIKRNRLLRVKTLGSKCDVKF